MGDSLLQLQHDSIARLVAEVSALREELRAATGGRGFLPVSRACKVPGVPFGKDQLRQLWEQDEIAGFLRAGRGRGGQELILDLTSIFDYCRRQCGRQSLIAAAPADEFFKRLHR